MIFVKYVIWFLVQSYPNYKLIYAKQKMFLESECDPNPEEVEWVINISSSGFTSPRELNLKRTKYLDEIKLVNLTEKMTEQKKSSLCALRPGHT